MAIPELRKAVRLVNETLAVLQVQKHPDKKFIGRTAHEFAFLGYQLSATGLTGVAPPTMLRFVVRIYQLYEQGATASRIGDYVRRWLVWVTGGLDNTVTMFCDFAAILSIPSVPIPTNTKPN